MDLYIADDNDAFAEYVATVARREGWTPRICKNGIELLDALKSDYRPAFLIIDVNMPIMDGIEVIEGLLDILRPMSIRFVTGGPDSHALAAKMIANARSMTVGPSLYKPVSVKTLRDVLAGEAKSMQNGASDLNSKSP
ncbi:response regulator [Salipiger sp. HF18]|uniref:response regulator n=1 Tax=Salipiger sp. HF18 TaxID=2721557 RepID=UPI00142E7F70|nr:response regulator [Salipiger sp. HF18]NIY95634.1 response regulator [Salipiger sp. HF18]